MKTWLNIALRNLLKNWRRSLYTILAIGLGFAAINIFGGFTDYVFASLRDSFIYIEGNGHLSIFKRNFRESNQEDRIDYLITREEADQIKELALNQAGVLAQSPILRLTGMVSNGDISTIFVGIASMPSADQFFASHAPGLMGRLRFFDGRELQDDVPYGVGLANDLAAKLGLDIGSSLIVMAPTIDGQINALDAEVFQHIDTPMELLEDKLITLSLQFAQTLYDTTSIHQINILLEPDSDLESSRQTLVKSLHEQKLDMEIFTWRELSAFYIKVEKMFEIIFLFIFIIVFIIIVMSVVNTVSMAVFERTREIGTLRAIGVKRRGILWLFGLESTLLGVLGTILGIVLETAGLGVIEVLEPTWTPPQVVKPLPLEVYVVPEYFLASSVGLISLSFIAGIMTARKMAYANIVKALGYV